ncbi:XRE family transcriptional regulator [Streptomyces asoensis]|uniref:XRE family transcriptional regulator n=1 Tax=Streptomyces asoensis TaxID=249586 RepID=A0A6M4WM85_9ACTN|nr:XRE family transcriptional regulator [Streptomyces asoensis]QJS98955.1 XRE family transcriptional regulator [Streptomyces asoensis]QJT06514.1 XRE family transcriptional regulator [Streptomyces asoensis]
MGDIDDALERAGRETFTREPPKTLKGQIGYLMRRLGITRAVAAEVGVSRRSVERYLKGERKRPPRAIADRVDDAVRARWQPRVRQRARSQAAGATGITIETRARFGYSAPAGTTDDGRYRRLTVHLPPQYARRLFDARDAGAGDAQLRHIVAEGLQEIYFKDGGRRADGLEVELNDIDYFDVSF